MATAASGMWEWKKPSRGWSWASANERSPGVTHNTEHVFGLCVPPGTPVRLAPREHTAFVWLPWREAADRCFSPSNAEAILQLPHLASGAVSTQP